MSRVASYACALVTSTALLFIISAVGPGVQAQPQQFFDAGQERQAIFPVYDGYRKNEDGSLTLSFAYFSHNATPVEIPPGEDNFFSSAADIGQPTVFFPGHHRWQCIVVVGPDFDGDLRWTLTHAGSTTSTSESMLQYNWEFAEADERNALRAIEDPTVEPRNVCLNRPPIVRVLGYGGRTGPSELRVVVGEGLKLFGSVRDEGLPKGDAVSSTWQKVSGPGAVRFDDAYSPRTLAFFSEAGDYIVQLTGTDSILEGRTEVKVVVTQPRVLNWLGVTAHAWGGWVRPGVEVEDWVEEARGLCADEDYCEVNVWEGAELATHEYPVPEANRQALKWVFVYRDGETPRIVVEEAHATPEGETRRWTFQ